MKQKVIEPVLGICLLAMVVMAVKYGSIHVTGSGDAYIKETPVVVVDAGHGGTDPGKVGVDGSLEKDINLAVAERLKTYLEQDDVKVIMTRETDTGLYSETDSRKKMADMKKRCEIIEESGADLVVSIHQNSYHEESVSGGQVFYYRDSSKGKALAEILQDRFDYVLGDQNRRLPKANANYYLLLHVKCPIVIVECGFLSNRKEAALLNSGEYQDKLAYTIHMRAEMDAVPKRFDAVETNLGRKISESEAATRRYTEKLFFQVAEGKKKRSVRSSGLEG